MSSVAKPKEEKSSGFCTKIPPKPKEPKANPQGIDRCFAGNLSWKIDEEKVKRAFEELDLGVVHVFWVTDKTTGQFYGSSFLTFESAEHAAWAVAYAEGKNGIEACTQYVTTSCKQLDWRSWAARWKWVSRLTAISRMLLLAKVREVIRVKAYSLSLMK